MMTATMKASGARRAARAKARLLLAIGDEVYEIRPLLDDADGIGPYTLLRKADGGWFKVWSHPWGPWPELAPPKYRHHCDECGLGRCAHIRALNDVDIH